MNEKTILSIDRTKPFDPVAFIGNKGWRIEEQDEQSLALTEVDPAMIRLETCRTQSEEFITS